MFVRSLCRTCLLVLGIVAVVTPAYDPPSDIGPVAVTAIGETAIGLESLEGGDHLGRAV